MGTELGAASPVGNPYLFTGRRYDPETGLYYYRARYYDPDDGEFLTRDPLGFWGDPDSLGNPMAYCGNDFWNRRDPSGLQAGRWQTYHGSEGPGIQYTYDAQGRLYARSAPHPVAGPPIGPPQQPDPGPEPPPVPAPAPTLPEPGHGGGAGPLDIPPSFQSGFPSGYLKRIHPHPAAISNDLSFLRGDYYPFPLPPEATWTNTLPRFDPPPVDRAPQSPSDDGERFGSIVPDTGYALTMEESIAVGKTWAATRFVDRPIAPQFGWAPSPELSIRPFSPPADTPAELCVHVIGRLGGYPWTASGWAPIDLPMTPEFGSAPAPAFSTPGMRSMREDWLPSPPRSADAMVLIR